MTTLKQIGRRIAHALVGGLALNEAEWLACAHPKPMLDFLRGKASDRKLRLFACVCCRSFLPKLYSEQRIAEQRIAVELAERLADGMASEEERRQALMDAEGALDVLFPGGNNSAAQAAVNKLASIASSATHAREVALTPAGAFFVHGPLTHAIMIHGDCRWLASLLRDIFGNPFRPSPPLPPAVLAWNDRTIPRIAQVIYDDRKLPEGTLNSGTQSILADALLDAGCDNDDLIQHCRSEGPHVRGCWAVDLILGKS
jgi:hypothetical protein